MNAQNTLKIAQELTNCRTETAHRVLLIDTLGALNQSTDVPLETQFSDKLHASSFEVIAVARDTKALLQEVANHMPDVLILVLDVVTNEILVHLFKLYQTTPVPVLVFAQQHNPQVLESLIDSGVSTYIVGDVKASRLPVIVDLAKARFVQLFSLNSELQRTKDKLDERKLIERAKGIIMQQKKISEEEAYAQLRRSAMNQGKPMVELAKRVIDVFEMLRES